MEAQKKLIDYIESHGVKQSFISNATGITVQRMSKLCNLKTGIELDEFFAIADLLSVPAETFHP